MDRLNPTIAELSQAIEQEAEKWPEARLLRTHPGVGALTALAFVLIIGKAERFGSGKQVASYLGLVPLEDSSGQQRLGPSHNRAQLCQVDQRPPRSAQRLAQGHLKIVSTGSRKPLRPTVRA
jgi:transposase